MKSRLEFVTVAFIVLFHVLLFIIAAKRSHGLITNFRSYFTDVWNVIDLFIIVMSFCCIILFSYRIVLVGEFLESLKYARKNEFISFDHLFVIEDILSVVAGLLVCITTIRLWKLLRFAQVFQKLERILLYSVSPLAVLFCCQLIIIVAFGVSGYILFGRQTSYFKSVVASIVSLFYISLNLYQSFDYSILTNAIGSLGNMYHIFFMFTTFTIYTLYVTAIILGCEKSDEYFSNKEVGYSVWDFLKEELFCFVNSFNIWKLNGSTSEEITTAKVYPKENAIRYENCVRIPTRIMQAMKAVVKVVLANGEIDFETTKNMVEKVRLLEAQPVTDDGEKNELFLAIQDESGEQLLIDDRKLLEMERVVQQLFGKEEIVAADPRVHRFREIERLINAVRKAYKSINVTEKDT